MSAHDEFDDCVARILLAGNVADFHFWVCLSVSAWREVLREVSKLAGKELAREMFAH
jgi:hypothetical protein